MSRKTLAVLFVMLGLLLVACGPGGPSGPPGGPPGQPPDGGQQTGQPPSEDSGQPAAPPASDGNANPGDASTGNTDTGSPAAVGDAEGYTLFAPLMGTTTYLIDSDGQVVNAWQTSSSGHSVYLTGEGNLLATASVRSDVFDAGGSGGRVEEYTWDGELVWSFDYSGPTYHLHHDMEQLPNGNLLMIAWEYKSRDDVLAAGRDPSLLPDDGALWPDHLIEVNPATNQIVWEWHVWDHLVQDVDASKPNYGVVAEHPELIDLNYVSGRMVSSDWNHTNSVDYNPALDQIVLSIHSFSEIWVIDHSTTTAEAAGHSGGNSGRGGDLLYRWGNPAAYGAAGQQQLYTQHDAEWIEPGLPGEGNILIFNNGDRQARPYSSIVEIAPPVDAAGNYALSPGTAYGPVAPVWEYVASPAEDFYAMNISSSQRLANGNTLICDGPAGHFFEVTAAGAVVWEYTIPATDPDSGVMAFRAERYTADYAGLAGRSLTSSGTVPAQSGPPGGGGDGGPPNGGPPGGGPPGGGGG